MAEIAARGGSLIGPSTPTQAGTTTRAISDAIQGVTRVVTPRPVGSVGSGPVLGIAGQPGALRIPVGRTSSAFIGGATGPRAVTAQAVAAITGVPAFAQGGGGGGGGGGLAFVSRPEAALAFASNEVRRRHLQIAASLGLSLEEYLHSLE